MKKNLPVAAILFLLVHFCNAQNKAPLVKQWDARFGGDSLEYLNTIHQTRDGGYILGGQSESDSSGDKTQPSRGGWDFWIVKTDSLAVKQWDKRFGGSSDDYLFAIQQTKDGGYIMGGTTISDTSGDVSEPKRGNVDCWVVRTDSVGNKLWDKRYGGTGADDIAALLETPDGGYLFAGSSSSDSGAYKSQKSRGSNDYWIIKTDALGNMQWDKRYGGSLNDKLTCLQHTSDGGYMLGGYSTSDSSGDKTQKGYGNPDYWIVKIDSLGSKQWDKRFGAAGFDDLFDLHQTKDGGYILGGYSTSDTSATKTQPTKGRRDFWIVKIDAVGNEEWDRSFGGTLSEDEFGYVIETKDNGYLLSGASYSAKGGDKTENNLGYEQSWIVKTDCSGNLLWDKTIFTVYDSRGHDEGGFALPTNDGGYVVANYCYGDTGGYKTQMSRGSWDYWMVKFHDTTSYHVVLPGIISAQRDTVCSGNAANLIITGSTGNIQWQSSGNGISFTNIPGAYDSVYTSSTLTQTTYFRVVVPGNCNFDSTSYKVITVLPVTVAGMISTPKDTVCENTISHLAITGNSGAAIQWQSSDTTSGFTDITGATGTAYSTPPAVHTTYFRAVSKNGSCADTTPLFRLVVVPAPVAQFTSTDSGNVVTFNSSGSTGDGNYTWNFGDNSTTSNDTNPVHTFNTDGTYHVCLTVENNTSCNFIFCKNVVIVSTIMNNINPAGNWKIYPDPVGNNIYIRNEAVTDEPWFIEIYDMPGRLLLHTNMSNAPGAVAPLDVSWLNAGMYYIRIKSGYTYYGQKIIKE